MEEESIKVLELGVKNNPKDLNLLTRLAYKKELHAQYLEARELYERILKIDSKNSYAKQGLTRVSNVASFKSYTEYKQTDAVGRDRSGLYNVNDKFEQTFITQRFSQYLKGGFNLGLEYHDNSFEKEATVNHEIDESNVALSLSKSIENLYLYASLGQSSYEANNVGSGVSGEGDILAGTFLANYQFARNSTTLSFSRDYYAVDLGSYLELDKLKVYDLQNQFSLTQNFSLLGRITHGVSANLDYIIYKLSPNYAVDALPGLNLYLSFESFDNKASQDYSEQALGTNYARDWNDKFESTLWVEYGRQDTGDRTFLFSELVNKFNFTDSKAVILTFEASHDYARVDTETYGASLALDMHF